MDRSAGLPAARDSREWLCTNGLGSYASGTISGLLTRRYHGLFVPSCAPPLARRVLWSKCDAGATYLNASYELSTNRWKDGTLAPRGDDYLLEFRLDGSVPVWTYAIADALIERRVWMEHGAQRTYVAWRVRDASAPVTLALKVYVNDRDYHGLTRAHDVRDVAAVDGTRARIRIGDGAAWYLHAPGAQFETAAQWYYGFRYDAETERGLDDTEDLYHALTVHATLDPKGAPLALCASFEDQFVAPSDPHARDAALLASAAGAPPWIARLTLAADQFVVAREVDGFAGTSIIAGYHWFGDWGRDAMIALPGLTLATGRPEIARSVLRTFARTIEGGMLPNCFADASNAPLFNSVDAGLWFIEATRAYFEATRDGELVAELFDAIAGIVDAYARGARYGIAVDAADGLLRAGEPGVQVTWMDAKIGDWVVTPRIGKPIEVNALWYNALCSIASFANALERRDGARYEAMAAHARDAFGRFWNEERRYAFDVIDGPGGDDASIRPNALFPVSLPHRPFDASRERAIVDRVARELWTPMGVRSLAPSDPAYTGHYGGSPRDRDAAYHRGTAWPYLAGAFARAYANAYGDAAQALRWIETLALRVDTYGVGTLAEIAEGDAPHAERGCIAQAWSVGEILRTWHELKENRG